MGVSVPQILDDALSPLEAFLAERPARVQCHHCTEIFQLFAFLCRELKKQVLIAKLVHN